MIPVFELRMIVPAARPDLNWDRILFIFVTSMKQKLHLLFRHFQNLFLQRPEGLISEFANLLFYTVKT